MGKFDERKFNELNQKVDNLSEAVATLANVFDYAMANAAAGNGLQTVTPPIAPTTVKNDYLKN